MTKKDLIISWIIGITTIIIPILITLFKEEIKKQIKYDLLFYISCVLLFIVLVSFTFNLVSKKQNKILNSKIRGVRKEHAVIDNTEQPKKRKEKAIQHGKEYLRDLSEDEKKVLREYIIKGKKTNYYKLSNGVVQGLKENYILRRSSIMSEFRDMFPYNIQPWVWKYLKKNQNLLK